jgi:hypothetical protein
MLSNPFFSKFLLIAFLTLIFTRSISNVMLHKFYLSLISLACCPTPHISSSKKQSEDELEAPLLLSAGCACHTIILRSSKLFLPDK